MNGTTKNMNGMLTSSHKLLKIISIKNRKPIDN